MSVRDPVQELFRDAPFTRVHAVLDALPAPLAYVDRSCRCRYVNRACAAALGRSRAVVRGKPFAELIGEHAFDALRAALDSALAGAAAECEVRLASVDAQPRPFAVRCLPDEEDGEIVGVILQFEEPPLPASALPQGAVAGAGRRTDDFLAILAHDLRNPLASIRNAVQLLQLAEGDRALTASARAMIERQLKQLVRLIDDLLDVSRITYGRFELHCQRIDLAAIARHALETSRPLLESRQHRVQVIWPEEALFVEGDAARLAQVFSNLLDNAAKYSEANGEITIAAMRENGYALVKVADRGMGIAPAMLPHVFDMFTRAGGNGQEGLGVGLTLARRLVELHGGAIAAESAGVGEGSVFSVRLPLAPAASAEATPSPARRADAPPELAAREGLRVLVVDDDHDAAASLALLLDLHGHEVRTANDGVEALAIAEDFRPEAVLLDIGMPRLDGYEAARAIRRAPWGAHIQLLAVSGWGEDQDRQRAVEAGFDHHLTKPVDPHVVQRLLARRHVRRSPDTDV